jgi:BCCT family betaine/carnitine transporter
MFVLYASTFDAITLVMSSFSYKKLDIDENPAKQVKLYWVAVFIILPIALVFLDSTTQLLMSLAIIGAFPMTIIMTLVIISFFKEIKQKKVIDDERQ